MRNSFLALISLFVITLFLSGCGDSNAVKLVKSGKFTDCSKTVEQAVNGFWGSPKWDSGIGQNGPTKGLTLVNLRGKLEFNGKRVNAQLQFIVDEKSGTFEAYALEVNEIPQSQFMIMGLVTNMCTK